jgi:hypothetical protein
MSRPLRRSNNSNRQRRRPQRRSVYASKADDAAIVRGARQSCVRYTGEYMPLEFHNIMRYCEMWAVTTAGGVASYIFRMNSVYDPYQPVGGASVYGMDEMTAIYDFYHVRRSDITVEVVNEGDPIEVVLYPARDTGAPIATQARSAADARSALVHKSSGKAVTLRHSLPLRALFPQADTDVDHGSVINGNPSIVGYWKIFVANTTAANLNATLKVTILYHTKWYSRNSVDDTDG